MAEHASFEPVRGGIACFQAGATVHTFEIPVSQQLKGGVTMEVDANTVRVVWPAGAEPTPSIIDSITDLTPDIATLVGPDDEYWIDLPKSEYAHIAMKVLSTMGRSDDISATLVYNVRFNMPYRVATALSGDLERIVTDLPSVYPL